MLTVKENERSWNIRLISDINMYISSLTLCIKRVGGESGISTGRKTLFPDLLLFGDEEQTQILQGWELKMPDVPVTDEKLISNAEKKARMLKLNSFVLWNFTTGVLYVLNPKNDRYEIKKTWAEKTNHIRNREDVYLYRDDWFDVIKEMLFEINSFIINGNISSIDMKVVLSEHLMSSIVLENKHILADYLKENCAKDAIMNSWLKVWWNEVKDEYVADERDYYSAYAKVILLNWVNKFIFVHLIKKYHLPARKISNITENTSPEEAIRIFDKITNQCDFYNIFSSIPYNHVIPNSVWKQFIDLNIFLSNKGLESIKQESLHSILENTVQILKREIRGQFTTPQLLADILVQTTVKDWTSHCIDPCCGTGTITKSILNNKRLFLSEKESYQTTWASDKYTFPLQIANISMVNPYSINIPCQIFNKNAFEIKPNLEVNIINPTDGSNMKLNLPKFEAIVSNLPFIAFEKITTDEKQYINNIIDNVEKKCNVILNKKGDIYSYLIFSLWSALEDGGRMGIIISNSWLATDWGINFRKALLRYFNIINVIISGNGRWFKNAKIVTTIIILEKKTNFEDKCSEKIHFSVIKNNIDDIKDNKKKIDEIINSINLKKSLNPELIEISRYSLDEIQVLDSLHISWNALFYSVNWLLKVKEKLCPIDSVFEIIRGSRRGWNDMFYPKEGHDIESQYIIKGLKDPKKIEYLTVEATEDIFCCGESLKQLQEEGAVGTLNWINKFSKVVNSKGVDLPQKLLGERNKTFEKYWYHLNPDYVSADFVAPIGPNERIFVARTSSKTFFDQRLIGLTVKLQDADEELLHALLNSILTIFYIEAIGFGRGEGLLDISKQRFSRMVILDPSLLDKKSIDNIKTKFRPLTMRKILKTSDELEQLDRKEFDIAVLKAYGLEEYYDSIKSSLLTMQKSRLSVNN